MTILLIEDNPLFGELMELSLSNEDIHVVGSLEAAKNWLEVFHADLLLVDLNLPDSHGLKTLEALSSVRIPKIVLTATQESPIEAAKRGAIDFIHKASDFEDIIVRVQFHINRLAKGARFKPEIFEEIKACIGACHLTYA